MFDEGSTKLRKGLGLCAATFLVVAACSSAQDPTKCSGACAVATLCVSECACADEPEVCRSRCEVTLSFESARAETSTIEQELLDEMNDARARGECCQDSCPEENLAPLEVNAHLQRVATEYAVTCSQRGFIDHTGELGESPLDRTLAADFVGCAQGENLARGYNGAREVVDAWLASPEHCRNLLAPEYSVAGVGVHAVPDQETVWVVEFGGY